MIHREQIPCALFAYPQWVCWRYIERREGRKPDKQPVNSRMLGSAGMYWANTWTSFEEAYVTYLRHCNQQVHGIGFVLTQADPYVAVDLYSCVQEGELDSVASQIVADVNSYTEVSPSGRGIRILLACPGFHDNARRAAIEVYSYSRYVTVTGQHVAGTSSTISVVAPDVIAALVPPLPKQDLSTQTHAARAKQYSVGDTELWERIFAHE